MNLINNLNEYTSNIIFYIKYLNHYIIIWIHTILMKTAIRLNIIHNVNSFL